jgi:DNA-binding NtrC family response regulator
VKLLRALQEREIIPVGGNKPIKIDIRLIAATNADLEQEVRENRFRTDLFYRLNVIPIRMPPLRHRRDDIPLLVEHFLRKFAERSGVQKSVAKDAMETFMRYDWPGNVRELENVIERAVILSDDSVIDLSDLPEKVVRGEGRRGSLVIDSPDLTLEELEHEYIMKVLNYTSWQKKRASQILGINASTLYRKLQAYKAGGLLPSGMPDDAMVEEDQDAVEGKAA